MGDAAHKPNPIGGQGGNAAIEPCVEFVNFLKEKKEDQRTGLVDLNDMDITDIFSQTQAAERPGRGRCVFATLVQIQIQTIGRVAPIHAAIRAVQAYELTPGCHVLPEVAKALMPVLILNYNCLAFWPLLSPLFSSLTWVFSRGLRWWQAHVQPVKVEKKETAGEEPEYLDRYKAIDVPVPQSVYKYAFILQAIAHVAVVGYSYSKRISPANIVLGLPSLINKTWELSNICLEVATFFKFDQVFAAAASIASNLYSIWDLTRLGYIKTQKALGAAVIVIAGQLSVGSGATWAGLWYWREGVLFSLEK
ncbi:putative FAD binding domain protein [Seiridium cardinale]|uniref:FAD binding domain protein n=1 Tax=Seiridium cardinale TaxID=138064 RepID=A0ABR2XMW6_9PEZI